MLKRREGIAVMLAMTLALAGCAGAGGQAGTQVETQTEAQTEANTEVQTEAPFCSVRNEEKAAEHMEHLQEIDRQLQEILDNIEVQEPGQSENAGVEWPLDREKTSELMDLMHEMAEDINWARYLREPETVPMEGAVMIDGEIRRVSASRYEGMSAGAYLSADQRAVVFWGSGGDSYFQWYVLDGILFGSLRGDSGGNIYFNGCLPEWAEDPSGGPERHDVPEINKKLWKEIPYESAVEDLQGQWTEMKKQLEEFETQKSTQK